MTVPSLSPKNKETYYLNNKSLYPAHTAVQILLYVIKL